MELNTSRGIARFMLPIVLENCFTTFVNFVFSSITGRIGPATLLAMGTTTTLITFLLYAMNCVTASSAVLTARACGEGDLRAAARAAETGMFLAIVVSFSVSALLLIFRVPVMRFLAPGADAALTADLSNHYSLQIISFPFYLVYTESGTLLKADGDSSRALISAVVMNLSLLAFSFLFIVRMGLGMRGCGFACLAARAIAAVSSLICLLTRGSRLSITLPGCLKPDTSMIGRIMRIGIPTGLEQICVQGGYLVVNSLVVGLGTHIGSVNQLLATVQKLPCIVPEITIVCTVTLAGMPLGACDVPRAKKTVMRELAAAMTAELALGLVMLLSGSSFASLFTTDADVLRDTVMYMPLIFIYLVLGQSINVIDPALRTGGDTRFTLAVSGLAVWAVRIPLTYFFCYKAKMGIPGVLYANYISLFVRAAAGLIRFRGNKWYAHRV